MALWHLRFVGDKRSLAEKHNLFNYHYCRDARNPRPFDQIPQDREITRWKTAEMTGPNNSAPMWKLQGAEPLAGIAQKHRLHYTDVPIHFDLLAGKIVASGGDFKLTVRRAPRSSISPTSARLIVTYGRVADQLHREIDPCG